MSSLVDGNARQRFACELSGNFSVVASAGSGKTRAITDRVAEIARSHQALEWLPELVVVTYTNRAADEMQQRARQQILNDAKLSKKPEVIEAFNRAFFGTIHSFCMKLLATHGHHLGLPRNLELIADDADLWNEFVQQYTTIGRSLSEQNQRILLRHVQARQLMELARNAEVQLRAAEPERECSDISFAEVYAANEKPSLNIAKAKAELKRWEKRWRETDEFVAWPACAKQFGGIWREAFRPLRDRVNACALCVAAEVQRDYREFRLERGLVTYADQVALAGELMQLSDVARRIRDKNYRVILDEAQDTDPQQFFVLLQVAGPSHPEFVGQTLRLPNAALAGDALVLQADWRSNTTPRPGHFCMVGDFQQSIYRDPTDLTHYRELHQLLVTTGAAEELKFSVTFRLDTAQLDFVNATFGEILNNQDGQVEFVELNPRPEILPGQVIRFDFACDVDPALPERQREILEARELAAWLRDTSLENLRAESWRQAAILCPRKAWLRPLRNALVDIHLPVEVHSETDRQGESPAYAWLTALLTIMADPNASYEIVGVLREIFGLSDDDLHRFSQGYGARFQISKSTRLRQGFGGQASGSGVVANTLNRLVRIREAIAQQPLFSAVQEIIRTTQLRERMLSLPEDEFGDLDSELDALLSAAATAEARGLSLSDFGQSLRSNFHATRETHPSPREAIQLITAHKAKGSEWQAVIVPFLTREVRDAPPRYPYIIRSGNSRSTQIVFNRTDFDEYKDELKQIERQEMERLLYVALTRAKHTLVLAFDRQFFRNARGQFHRSSQISWLRAGGGECNCEALAALSTETRECTETRDKQKSAPREQVSENLGKRELDWIDDARQRAARFIHTTNPSKFAPASAEATAGSPEEGAEAAQSVELWSEIEPELRPTRIDNPATRYGIWWHQFAQQIPWESQTDAWQAAFDRSVATSPDPARSRREWKLLNEFISEHQDFLGGNVFVEMPFFWRMPARRSLGAGGNANECLEGIIDLALFRPAAQEWFILDWKTNRIEHDEIDKLRAEYRPQIAAYWKALTEMTKRSVSARIFSTATGQLIIYDQTEVANEWERLRNLLPDDLAGEIATSG
jgi:ATP-dependent exoDNAse (exonuclease V) beta subunit